MIAEYLEHALQFERLASLEENPNSRPICKSRQRLPQAGDRTHQKARHGAAQNFKLKILLRIRFQAWRGFNLRHGRSRPTRAIS